MDNIPANDNLNLNSDNQNNMAGIVLLPVLSVLAVILLGLLKNNPSLEIIKLSVVTLILSVIAVFYIRFNGEIILKKKYARALIMFAYLSSIGLLLIPINNGNTNFWMFGGLLVGMTINNKLGLLLHFNLSFIAGLALTLRPENVICFLIMGILLTMLAESLKQLNTMIYAGIIILSTNVTLAFVTNNFLFESKANHNYLISLISMSVVLLADGLLYFVYDRFNVKTKTDLQLEEKPNTLTEVDNLETGRQDNDTTARKEDNENESVVNKSEFSDKAEMSETPEKKEEIHNDVNRTSYELMSNENHELMLKMKAYSDTLYDHSIKIGDLSYRAAIAVGANNTHAKAGGLYHEIGRINGNNYIEEGLKIAEEYQFPDELRAILKQHNIKYEKPTSMEAVIVMLSDNIISTIDYLEKTGENKYSMNKVIDNIFQMRMDKGTFDNSGLSLMDFKNLKEFFIKEFNGMK
jgi:putative nucleotidyltransferase with HDIG domain